jgi:hypothetical protein
LFLMLLCCLHLVLHDLLFMICCSCLIFLPCWLLGLAALPSRTVTCLIQVHPTPPCCFATLLLVVMPCCFALSIGIPSSFSYASGRVRNNTNKFHPTTKVFFFPRFSWVFFFFILYFVCLFRFCLSFKKNLIHFVSMQFINFNMLLFCLFCATLKFVHLI